MAAKKQTAKKQTAARDGVIIILRHPRKNPAHPRNTIWYSTDVYPLKGYAVGRNGHRSISNAENRRCVKALSAAIGALIGKDEFVHIEN